MLQSRRVASVGRFSLMIYERGALLVFEKRAEARLSSVYCLCVSFESKQRTVYGVQISSIY